MKLKKKAKVIIFIILLIIIAIISLLVYKTYFKEEKAKEATVINEIKEYGYTLKSNKSAAYKKEFENLITILNNDSVNEEDYVKQISRMFILDFYSLSDKVANTDVGGVDFVHSAAVSNFLEKAEDTIYKYIENDMYGKRAQVLPTVDEITISDVSQTSYTIAENTDDNAYTVSLTWTYEEESDYQNEAILTFVHEDKKLSLVEME